MDALHLSIALGPLAVYLCLVGLINLTRRPFLTTGARDAAALGVSVSGFMVAGPLELFLPQEATLLFGGYVWLLLLGLYVLCLILIVLLMRPRLIIYNTSSDQLRPLLAEVVSALDPEARWAGDSLALPSLGVQLHVESLGSMRCVQLVSAGPQQSHSGWRRLELELAASLREARSIPSPYGLTLVLVGLVMLVVSAVSVLRDPQTVAQSLREMLRL